MFKQVKGTVAYEILKKLEKESIDFDISWFLLVAVSLPKVSYIKETKSRIEVIGVEANGYESC